MSSADDGQDWRMCVELHGEGAAAGPHGILHRFRGPQVVDDARQAIGDDVVLTHDGEKLFGYARDRAALDAAREKLVAAVERDGLSAGVTISHWEDDIGEWTQVEPPLDAGARAQHERVVRDAHAPTTQTFTVQVGREARAEVEQTMQRFAQEQHLSFQTVEHPHLLRTQVAFTVSGTQHDVDEFRDGLRAEELATIRTAEAMSFGV